MSSFSDYLENELLDHVFAGLSYTPPTPYIALFTTPPTDAGTGTEASGGSYARVDGSAKFGTPAASGSISNSADIEFPVATASWGTVTHVGIYDASTAGNLLAWAALDVSKAINTGDLLKFTAGQLVITLD